MEINKKVIAAIVVIILVVSASAYYVYYVAEPVDEWKEWRETLTIGTTWVMINADPHIGTSTGLDHNLAGAISDHLFWTPYDNYGQIECQLAEDFEVRYEMIDGVEKPYLWVKLREGLHWNDGSEIVAEDLVYSWRRLIQPDVGPEQFGVIQWLFNYDEFGDDTWVALSKYELKIRMKSDFPMIPIAMSGYACNVAPPIAKAVVDKYPIGSNDIARWGLGGPLLQTECVPNDMVVLEVRGDYADPETGGWVEGMGKADEGWPPQWKKCVIRTYGSSASLALALKKGDIDIALPDVSIVDIMEFMEDPDIIVLESAGGCSRSLALNYKFPPLDDIRVRQAIAYALDFNENIEKVKHGGAELAESCVHSYYPYFVPAFKERYKSEGLRDLDKAQALLAEAGYPDGFETKMVIAGHYAPIEEERNDALIIQDQLADIGITMVIEEVDSGTWKAMRSDAAIPIHMRGFYPDFPDPENDLENLSIHGGSWGYYEVLSNQTKYPEEIYHFKEMNDLMEEGMELWDPEIPLEQNTARAECYRRQQEICAEEVFYLPAYFGKGFLCARSYVKNLKPHPVITNFVTPGILACWKEPPTTTSSMSIFNVVYAVPIAMLLKIKYTRKPESQKDQNADR